MWWLSRIATAAMPCSATRASAASIARTTSHGPGSRRPSQHSAPPRSESTSGAPARVMLPRGERLEIGRGERQPVGGVAEQIALDQDLRDGPRPVVRRAPRRANRSAANPTSCAAR